MDGLLREGEKERLTQEDNRAMDAIFVCANEAALMQSLGFLDMGPMEYVRLIVDKTSDPKERMPHDVNGGTLAYWATRIAAHTARRAYN